MTGRASKVALEMPIAEPLASHRQLNRALELMSDELFLPMYERRYGDESIGCGLGGMNHEDCLVWWAGLEAKARIEVRRAN